MSQAPQRGSPKTQLPLEQSPNKLCLILGMEKCGLCHLEAKWPNLNTKCVCKILASINRLLYYAYSAPSCSTTSFSIKLCHDENCNSFVRIGSLRPPNTN